MHEHSLMKGLVRQIEELASAQGARSVSRISVRLGALSHFSPEHFQEHFDEVKGGTCAENATLDMTMDEDPHAAHAQSVLIESIEVEVED